MKMHVDSFFAKGFSHFVCEDYVIHGTAPIPYIVLSDGCSTSPNTDVGARILAHKVSGTIGENPTARIQDTIAEAQKTVLGLGLPEQSLDVTLIIATIRDGGASVHFWGDGFCFYRRDGMDFMRRIYFQPNMPSYLSYTLCEGTWREYTKFQPMQIIEEYVNGELVDSRECEAPRSFHSLQVPLDGLECLAIASDGVESFVRREDSSHTGLGLLLPMPRPARFARPGRCPHSRPSQLGINSAESEGAEWEISNRNWYHTSIHRIAAEILGFKTTRGQFVKRRMKRMLKGLKADGVDHFDDLAVGGFVRCDTR